MRTHTSRCATQNGLRLGHGPHTAERASQSTVIRGGQRLTLVVLCLWVAALSAQAAGHTWTGNGPNGLWSTAANWENNAPPAANEASAVLIFPTTANRRTSTNNVTGLKVASLALQGAAYTLRGTGAGTDITLLPGAAFGAVAVFSGTGHTLDSSLRLTLTGTNSFGVAGGASISIAARLTGNGSFSKSGAGSLRLRGSDANSFTGVTLVQAGTLELFSASVPIPGPLFVGQSDGSSDALVSWLTGSQIADAAPVTVYPKGKLQLNAFNETIGTLSIVDGVVDTGLGVLTTGDIVWHPPASIGTSARLLGTVQLPSPGTNTITVLGTAGDAFYLEANLRGGSGALQASLEKLGPGQLHLEGSNSFNGVTLINEGILAAAHPRALGATNQTVFVASNTWLRLREVHVQGKTLTFAQGGGLHSQGASAWSGPIVWSGDGVIDVSDNSPNGKTLTLHGKLSGPGGFAKRGTGVLMLNGTVANTYAGQTFVQQGELQLANGPGFNVPAIPGMLRVGENANVSTKRVTWLAPGQLATNATLRVDVRGVADLQQFSQTIGTLLMNGGSVTSSVAGLLTLQGPLTNSAFSTIDAPLLLASSATNLHSQAGTLRCTRKVAAASPRIYKTGNQSLRLEGDSDYPGTFLVVEGSLGVYGAWQSTAIDVGPNTSLYGTGSAGMVTLNGGLLFPDSSPTSLRIQRLVGASNALLRADLLDATTYGSLECAQAPELNGLIALSLSLSPNFDPPLGTTFTLIHNQSAQPVGGVLRGAFPGARAEGVVIALNSSRYFRLSYQGGDGNDVTLTRIAPPVAPGPVQISTDPAGVQVTTTGTYGAYYFVESTDALLPPIHWVQLGDGVVAKADGTVSFVDADVANHPQRFYRFSQ